MEELDKDKDAKIQGYDTATHNAHHDSPELKGVCFLFLYSVSYLILQTCYFYLEVSL